MVVSRSGLLSRDIATYNALTCADCQTRRAQRSGVRNARLPGLRSSSSRAIHAARRRCRPSLAGTRYAVRTVKSTHTSSTTGRARWLPWPTRNPVPGNRWLCEPSAGRRHEPLPSPLYPASCLTALRVAGGGDVAPPPPLREATSSTLAHARRRLELRVRGSTPHSRRYAWVAAAAITRRGSAELPRRSHPPERGEATGGPYSQCHGAGLEREMSGAEMVPPHNPSRRQWGGLCVRMTRVSDPRLGVIVGDCLRGSSPQSRGVGLRRCVVPGAEVERDLFLNLRRASEEDVPLADAASLG